MLKKTTLLGAYIEVSEGVRNQARVRERKSKNLALAAIINKFRAVVINVLDVTLTVVKPELTAVVAVLR